MTREYQFDVGVSQLSMAKQNHTLFVGTSKGSVRTINYPTTATESIKFQDHFVHSSIVSKLCLTADEHTLFSVGEDGCLIENNVNIIESSLKEPTSSTFASEVLVTRTDWQERIQTIQDMRSRVEELKLENEYQLRLRDMNFSEKVKEMTDRNSRDVDDMNTAIVVAQSNSDRAMKQYTAERKKLKDQWSTILHVSSSTAWSVLIHFYEYCD